MKIPVEWLYQYIDIDQETKYIADAFTALGLMLDSPVVEYVNGEYKTYVLDLEHRMDRADWLSILGCARDLAALENLNLLKPELYEHHYAQLQENEKIKIKVECPELVYRFNTKVFKDIKVEASPDWLKNRLEAYGIPAKNNIVDITNYVMVETGQPMHAQDIDKLQAPEIILKKAENGQKITTLLGETVQLDDKTFVLTQNNTPTVIGGIVGGAATAVDQTTTTIILDAGNYNQTNIRKTSRRLKIQNETVLRYDKFLHPNLTEYAIQRATKLILDIAGGKAYENYDYIGQNQQAVDAAKIKTQNLRFSRIKKIGGIDFDAIKVRNILENLEYKILNESDNGFKVEVPYFRTDVQVEDDLVADILRINNYINIPKTGIAAAPPKEVTPKIYKFEDKLRQSLVELSAHEHITNPLVNSNNTVNNTYYQDKNKLQQIKLQNTLTAEKDALRTSIYQTLKPVVEMYKKHKLNNFTLFEVGKIYVYENESMGEKGITAPEVYKCKEIRQTQIICEFKENTQIKSKKFINGLFKILGVNPTYKIFNNTVQIWSENILIGELNKNNATLYNEPLLEAYEKHAKEIGRVVSEIPHKNYLDVTFATSKKFNYESIISKIKNIDLFFHDGPHD